MYRFIIFAAVPMALLAACGRTVPADQAQGEPMDTDVADLDIAAEPLPEVPEDALDEVAFAGTYVREGVNGLERLTLDPQNDSYRYAAADGEVTSGTFRRLEDNRRIAIDDIDGEIAYFSIANGSIFRLTNAEAPANQTNVSSQYRLDESRIGPPPTTAEPREQEADEDMAEPLAEARR